MATRPLVVVGVPTVVSVPTATDALRGLNAVKVAAYGVVVDIVPSGVVLTVDTSSPCRQP